MERVRRILHVDMDAFFASVEQRDDPALRGKPVAVGGDASRRGVVAAASYEARAFGVRSAIPMARAVRLCPSLVVVRPHFAKYRTVSNTVFALFRSVTPLVEPLSVDEAYLDVTENAWGEALGVAVARRLKERIKEETGLTASAGVAPNKFLAKIASGWKKPDGLTVIAPGRVDAFLAKLPVEALWGVGPVTAGKLRALGFSHLVDLRPADPVALHHAVGSWGETLQQLAFGFDERPVVPNRPAKSSGAETTFDEDLTDLEEIGTELDALAARTAAWLTRKRLRARTVTIKVRYGDFSTITRSDSHGGPVQSPEEVSARARVLLARTEAGTRPVRLLGVSTHGFVRDGEEEKRNGLVQLPLLPD